MEKIRVTTIIDYFAEPYLVKWKLKNKDWEKIGDEAKRVGSLVDKIVQDDINGNYRKEYLIDNDAPVNSCIKAWFKFVQENPEIVKRMIKFKENMQRELVLGDLVGHPDFILDDEIIDLKTSKSIGKSHWMQTAQYGLMAGGVKRISILRVDKESGEYEFKTLEEPFITFWQRKFQCRYEAFKEDAEFNEMMRVKLEEEKLG